MRTNALVLFSVITIIAGLPAAGAGQNLQPVPPGIMVADRADAPVTIRLNGVETIARDRVSLNCTFVNAAVKNVRAVVVVGVPGTGKYSAIFGGPLRPGGSETFSIGNVLAKKGQTVPDIAVDFVLYDDGVTWGPNTAGDGDYLMGVFEGRKGAYADATRLTAAGSEKDLSTWLYSAEAAENSPGLRRVFNTKWSAGYTYGYSRSHETFKRDFERRGTFSIELRLKAMQRDLGLSFSDATAAKP